jgi:hypothetical protein
MTATTASTEPTEVGTESQSMSRREVLQALSGLRRSRCTP